MVKKYYKEIDILKGVAILLVVLGHSISYLGSDNKAWGLVNEVIYNFHMSIFFFASGFLSYKILSFQKIEWKYLKGKAIRLIVPYITCGLLYFAFRQILSFKAGMKYTGSPLWKMVYGVNPSYSLWFLYVLFVCLALCILFVRSKNIIPIMIVALLLSIFFGFLTEDGFSPLNITSKIFKVLIYVLIGLWCGKNYDRLDRYFNCKVLVVCVLLFIGGNFALHYVTEVFLNNTLKIVTSLTAIEVLLFLSRKASQTKWSHILKQFGMNSMGIYVISGVLQPVIKEALIRKVHLNVTFLVLICFFVTVLLSFVITLLIKKIKVAKLLLLGETK